MNGESLMTKLGTNMQVNKRGVKKFTSVNLKIQLLQINLKLFQNNKMLALL